MASGDTTVPLPILRVVVARAGPRSRRPTGSGHSLAAGPPISSLYYPMFVRLVVGVHELLE